MGGLDRNRNGDIDGESAMVEEAEAAVAAAEKLALETAAAAEEAREGAAATARRKSVEREMARCAREEAEAAAACDARAERSRCIEKSVIVPYFTPLLQDIKGATRGVKL